MLGTERNVDALDTALRAFFSLTLELEVKCTPGPHRSKCISNPEGHDQMLRSIGSSGLRALMTHPTRRHLCFVILSAAVV